jgi:FdhD protein
MTGGVHSAALSDGDKIIAFAEDIGRHNAVDKVLGFCVLENIPFKGTIMMASGRLSSDIVNKCLTCSVPVIVSRTSPTSLAVEIAAASGITLIGFVRGTRMNIYSGKQRVRL